MDIDDRKKEEAEKKGEEESYQFMHQVIRERPHDWRRSIRKFLQIILIGGVIGVVAAVVFAAVLPLAENIFGVQRPTDRVSIGNGEMPSGGSSGSSEVLTVTSSSSSEDTEDEDGETSSDSEQREDNTSGKNTSDKKEDGTEQVNSSENNIGDADKDSSGGDGEDADAENAGEGQKTEDTSGKDSESDTQSGATGAQNSGNAADPVTAARENLDSYRDLYKDMLTSSEDVQHAMVQVSGITSELDYFNQNYTTSSQTSGIILAENSTSLFIVTGYRAVENCEKIQVTYYDGSLSDASFLKRDPDTGICIITTDISAMKGSTKLGIRTAPIGNSYLVTKGEPVLALGSPMGYSDSVAFGVVTSVNHKMSVADNEYSMLMTDIEGSESGTGVLVDLDGEVIGLICQSSDADGSAAITGIAISQITDLLEKLSNNEAVPYLGIKGQTVTADISERSGIPTGVLVTDVGEDSPAMLSGIKEYDVITDISGTQITSVQDYHRLLESKKEGEVLTVTAERRGAQGYAEVRFSVAVEGR